MIKFFQRHMSKLYATSWILAVIGLGFSGGARIPLWAGVASASGIVLVVALDRLLERL